MLSAEQYADFHSLKVYFDFRISSSNDSAPEFPHSLKKDIMKLKLFAENDFFQLSFYRYLDKDGKKKTEKNSILVRYKGTLPPCWESPLFPIVDVKTIEYDARLSGLLRMSFLMKRKYVSLLAPDFAARNFNAIADAHAMKKLIVCCTMQSIYPIPNTLSWIQLLYSYKRKHDPELHESIRERTCTGASLNDPPSSSSNVTANESPTTLRPQRLHSAEHTTPEGYSGTNSATPPARAYGVTVDDRLVSPTGRELYQKQLYSTLYRLNK